MRYIFWLLIFCPFVAIAQDEVVDTAQNVDIELSQEVDPYTVTNVVVDVTADNAVVARDEAFKKGSEIAVKAFLEAQGADIDLQGTNPDALVKSFKVEDENFSDTRYKATLTYKFKPRAIAILANKTLPFDRRLPVPAGSSQELVVDQIGTTLEPLNPDAAWRPQNTLMSGDTIIAPDGRSTRPDTGYGEQLVPTLSSWQLTVRFEQVPDWLMAQQLISGRPEVRGYKIATMSSNFAVMNMTTIRPAGEILSQWTSLGWRVFPGSGGLILDAGSLR